MYIKCVFKSEFNKYKFILLAQQYFVNAISFLFWYEREKQSSFKTVAIYRIGNIGDIICSIPAFIAVRETYSGARIILVTSPGKRENIGATAILKGAWFLDEIFEYYSEDISTSLGKRKLLYELRRKNIDLWINLPLDRADFRRILRDMIFAKLVGVKKAIGFEIGIPAHPELKKYIKLPLPNETNRLLEILKLYNITTHKIRFDLPFTEDMIKKCEEIIKKEGLPSDKPWVGVAPFSKQPATQWPVERFLEVARYLINKGFAILIFGGSEEARKGELFAKSVGRKEVFNLCGKLSILESAFMLKKCMFLVTNDSGPMHLASAVGTKCVAIFSAHNYPGQWEPYGEEHVVLRKEVSCSPCYLVRCPRNNMCINMITANEVVEGIRRLCVDL